MTGMRIYGQATFLEMFRPILHRLNDLVWVLTEGQFRFPPEWEDASEFDSETGLYVSGPLADFHRDFRRITEPDASGLACRYFGYISTADIFPKYAIAIDDSLGPSIFGVRLSPEQAREWLRNGLYREPASRIRRATRRAPWYARAVELAEVSFIIDESWCEFYTRNASLREALQSYLPHTTEWANPQSPGIQAAYEECSTK